MISRIVIIVVLLTTLNTYASITNNEVVMPFVKNVGQVSKHVAYYTNTPKAAIYIDTSGRINYQIINSDSKQSVVVRETFVGGQTKMQMQGEQSAQINMIKGRKKEQWHKNIPNTTEIGFGEVWKDTEVKLMAKAGNVEKLFVLKPHAQVEQIKIALQGIKQLSLKDNGELNITTDLALITFTQPVAWQMIDNKRTPIAVKYVINDNAYGFKLGQYNHDKQVIIDPLLGGSYAGGNLDEYAAGVHVNSANEIIIAGYSASNDFPITTGLISDTLAGTYDFVAMKFNADLSQLLAATYIGGSGNEGGSTVNSLAKMSVAFDANNNIYFAGDSSSTDFPLPTFPYTPYQETVDANGSMFIAKLSADFTEILGATHIGGSIVDLLYGIDIASNGNVYVVGFTNSTDYPYTAGAFETSGKGIVISAFSSDLTQLLYSTRLGGGSGYNIHIDADNSIYVVAGKDSTQAYTTTAGVYAEMPINSFTEQIYIAHLNSSLNNLLAASFVSFGVARNVTITPDNQLFIGARTTNNTFPVPVTAFDDTQLAGGSTTLFKMDKSMTAIQSASFLDMGFERVYVETDGNILLLGATSTLDFPGGNSPSDPLNSAFHGGAQDLAIARMNPDLTQVLNSAYIGGGNSETASGITKDSSGNVVIVAETTSGDVYLTASAYDNSNAGNGDILVLKATSDLNFGPSINDIFCDSFESPIANGACH